MRKTFTKNLKSVLQELYRNKHYKLIRKFCDSSSEIREHIFKHTSHVKGISNRHSQRIYHFIHNIDIPKHSNGTILAFKNLQEGYTTEHEPLYEIYLDNWTLHESIVKPILKYSKNPGRIVNSSKNIQALIMKKTSELPEDFNINVRTNYYANGYTKIKYCKICNKPLKHFKYTNEVCSKKCSHAKIFKSNNEMLNYLKTSFYSEKKTARNLLVKEISRNKILLDYVNNKTDKLFKNKKKPILQKVFHLINNIKRFPACKVCKKNVDRFNLSIYAYPATCSQTCNNQYSEHISKRLTNAKVNTFGYMLNHGKNEHALLAIIQEMTSEKLNKHKNITKYFPDAVDEKQKIVYEINEKHHLYDSYFNRDLEKYKVYIKEGYKIFILWDNINVNNKKNIKKLKKIKTLYKHNVRYGFYFDPEYKIMTDNGLSNFIGILKKDSGNDKVSIKMKKGNSIKCTKDHLLFLDDNKTIPANMLKIGDKIKTIDGEIEIDNIKKIKDKKSSYDVLQVELKNRFFANDVLVHNCLIIDECAVIDSNLFTKFWMAIYPVVSSSKNSSVIMVSTPRGVGNFFYETYENARLGNSKDGWKSYRIDWWDFPGRDEEWKQKQLSSLKNDITAFNREFGNEFTGSSYTLLKSDTIKKIKEFVISDKWHEPTIIPFNAGNYSFKQWFKPEKGHTYILGADVADGIGECFSTALIFDISNTKTIKLVASFGDNKITTMELPYVLTFMASLYNNAYIAMESNNMGRAVLDTLNMNYNYDNIISYGGKREMGIYSHIQVKGDACRWLRDLTSFDQINFEIYDKELVTQIEYFERKTSKKHEIYQATGDKFDDYVLAWVWAMFILKEEIADNYFDIECYLTNIYGMKVPLRLKSFTDAYFDPDRSDRVFDPKKIDKIYKNLIEKGADIQTNSDDGDDQYDDDSKSLTELTNRESTDIPERSNNDIESENDIDEGEWSNSDSWLR